MGELHVLPDPEYLGAYGAALIAADRAAEGAPAGAALADGHPARTAPLWPKREESGIAEEKQEFWRWS